jgi:hypothetical protein
VERHFAKKGASRQGASRPAKNPITSQAKRLQKGTAKIFRLQKPLHAFPRCPPSRTFIEPIQLASAIPLSP